MLLLFGLYEVTVLILTMLYECKPTNKMMICKESNKKRRKDFFDKSLFLQKIQISSIHVHSRNNFEQMNFVIILNISHGTYSQSND